MYMGRLLRFDGRFPTARFAVFTARSLAPSLDGFPVRKMGQGNACASLSRFIR